MPPSLPRLLSLLAAATAAAFDPAQRLAAGVRLGRGTDAAAAIAEALAARPAWIASDARLLADPTETLRDFAESDAAALRALLSKHAYTASAVAARFGVAERTVAPAAYARPATRTAVPPPPAADGLDVLLQLFVLGLSVPAASVKAGLGPAGAALLRRLGATQPCGLDAALAAPTIALTPLDAGLADLVFATDWRPPVAAALADGVEPVMYLSSCSLAMAQHLARLGGPRATVLDMFCGSGVLGIAAAATAPPGAPRPAVVCADANPRALRFAAFNAALNGRGSDVEVVACDVWEPGGGGGALSANAQYDLVLANPPFVPVPPGVGGYDAFSDGGGAAGCGVLRRFLSGVPARLAAGGAAAVVTELADAERWPERLEDDLWRGAGLEGALLRERVPWTAGEYAQRRGGAEGAAAWRSHLDGGGVASMSRALLFARRGGETRVRDLPVDGCWSTRASAAAAVWARVSDAPPA